MKQLSIEFGFNKAAHLKKMLAAKHKISADNLKKYIGKKINSREILDLQHYKKALRSGFVFLTKCDCGAIEKVTVQSVISNRSKSCFKCSILYRQGKINGLSKTPLYKVWAGMKGRCRSKRDAAYQYYGARGIKICERWASSFLNFLEDMGPRPDGYQIDRIDNDGNYEPGNCRWVSALENFHNRRTSKLNRDKYAVVARSKLCESCKALCQIEWSLKA
jgi:hypothetical protein